MTRNWDESGEGLEWGIQPTGFMNYEFLFLKTGKEKETTSILPQYTDELTEGLEYNESAIEYVSKFMAGIASAKSSWYDYKIDFLMQEVRELKNTVKQLVKKELTVIQTKIYSLPSDRYELKIPVDVILEIYADEVLALIPDLELYGEGSNEIESLNDLKLELLDLIDNLYMMPDNELGNSSKAWKKTLNQLVNKCR